MFLLKLDITVYNLSQVIDKYLMCRTVVLRLWENYLELVQSSPIFVTNYKS